MYILVKKGMLSAYGEIFRKGDVLELEDKVAERLLESEDFEACEEPVGIEPDTDTESADEAEDVEEEKPTKNRPRKRRRQRRHLLSGHRGALSRKTRSFRVWILKRL